VPVAPATAAPEPGLSDDGSVVFGTRQALLRFGLTAVRTCRLPPSPGSGRQTVQFLFQAGLLLPNLLQLGLTFRNSPCAGLFFCLLILELLL